MVIQGDPGNGLPDRTPPTGRLTIIYTCDQGFCAPAIPQLGRAS